MAIDMLTRGRLNITDNCSTRQVLARIMQGSREATSTYLEYIGAQSSSESSSDSDSEVPYEPPGPSAPEAGPSGVKQEPMEVLPQGEDDVLIINASDDDSSDSIRCVSGHKKPIRGTSFAFLLTTTAA